MPDTDPYGAPHAGAPTGVFLLDDHELIRRGLAGLLEAEPDLLVVGEAGSVAEAVPAILRVRPDVAVLDLRLPDGSGVEVCRQVRAGDPGIGCLILTSFDDPHALLAAIAAGAAGFVLKDAHCAGLVAAVREVAAGRSLLTPALTAEVHDALRPEPTAAGPGPGAPAGAGHEQLTAEERAVLRLVAGGLTDREVGERLFLPERTVKIHLTRVLVKLGLTGAAGPARSASEQQ
jgi:DNA-binding NarL/FixJ family response regulator